MTTVVELSHGRLRGTETDGVLCFRGIPYAAPPVGALRFKPPHPVGSWAGVRSAEAFGPAAPQLPNRLAQIGETSEDCLYLNVWTPNTEGKKPVMVFVHGGGYMFGAGHEPTYDGHALAARGDVIVVTLNYRLSAIGFLYLPEVLPNHDCAANVGLLDVVAALHWVQTEIAALGGDPANVTLFGESAGAGLVCTLCTMASARRLFARAISQSGGLRMMAPAAANSITRELLDVLEINERRPERLWELPHQAIVAATTKLTAPGIWGVRRDGVNAARPTFRFGAVADGTLIPEDPPAAVSGGANPVPMLIGTNLHEWRFFSRLVAELEWGGADAIRVQLATAFGARSLDLLAVYARAAELLGDTPEDIADAILGDAVFRMPSICFAEAASQRTPVFMYLLDQRCPRRRGSLGCCHVVDLPLVFRTLDSPTGRYFVGDSPDARTMCDVVSDAWVAFARTGDPRTPALEAWPRYDLDRRATRMLSADGGVVDDPLGEQRRAWEPLNMFDSRVDRLASD